MRLIAALVVFAGALPGAAIAQCRCANPDPYAALSFEEHRAKFDAVLESASMAYARLLAAVRSGELKQSKEEARAFAKAWDAVASGFWMRPPKGLDNKESWARWFPLAHERLVEGAQLVLSASDLKGARRCLEGGRWALVRLREANNAASVPDMVLRARQAEEAIRQGIATRDRRRLKTSCRRVRELAQAISLVSDSADAAAWCQRARALAEAPTGQALAAAKAASERLLAHCGDRLD